MKVFISYAAADKPFAKRVADSLMRAGLDVWFDAEQILPGDNWGAKIAEALQDSEAMVVLMTPAALSSDRISYEIAYALGQEEYSGRLIPVLAGPVPAEDLPWILNRLPMVRLSDYAQEEEGFRKIAQTIQESVSRPLASMDARS